jgi:hypothetical protein
MEQDIPIEFIGGPIDGKIGEVRLPWHGQRIRIRTPTARFRAVYIYSQATRRCHFVGYDVPPKYAYPRWAGASCHGLPRDLKASDGI